MSRGRRLALALAAAAAAPCVASEASVTLRIEAPRAYGYTIGDLLTQRVMVEVPARYVLDQEALPKPRRLSAWVALRSLQVEKVAAGALTGYSLRADYQLLNSPAALKSAAVPGWQLGFNGPGMRLEKAIPAFSVSMAPLADTASNVSSKSMRPDRLPPLLATQAYWRRLALDAMVAAPLAVLCYWITFGSLFARNVRGPFARAYRDLRGIVRSPSGRESYSAALQRLHRAFDEAAGRTLFAEHLDAFFAGRPGAEGMRAETVDFFALSRREFFATEAAAPTQSVEWLMQFCRRWRDRER